MPGSGVLKSTFTMLSVLGERINASEPLRSPWSWKETRHITAVKNCKKCIRIQIICETVFMQMEQEAWEELYLGNKLKTFFVLWFLYVILKKQSKTKQIYSILRN